MGPTVSVLTAASTQELVAAALAAPSMHNTQPWQFAMLPDDRLRIYADQNRLLPISDPGGRALYIATGAAVHNICLAARRLGYSTEVSPLPEPGDSSVLADIRLIPDRDVSFAYADAVLYHAITRRHTNRFPFRKAPIPAKVMRQLEESATAVNGVSLKSLSAAEAEAALALVRQANRVLESDPLYVAELTYWTRRHDARADGVPVSAFGRRPEQGTLPMRDFALGTPGAAVWTAPFESEPRLLVVATDGDLPADWLHAGEALQRTLLVATICRLSVSYFYQPFQVDVLRSRMRHAAGVAGYPQLLFRLGYGRLVNGPPRRQPTEAMRQ
ncbi:nitroreductase family protein [Flindersiella endophytica]